MSEAVGSLVACVQLVSGDLSQETNVTIQSQDGTAKGRKQLADLICKNTKLYMLYTKQ